MKVKLSNFKKVYIHIFSIFSGIVGASIELDNYISNPLSYEAMFQV
jgi:hypothetical protein